MGGMRVLRWWSRAYERGEESHKCSTSGAERAFVLFCGKCTVLGDMAALIKAFSDSFTQLLFKCD